MNNTSLSSPVQEIIEYGSQLSSIYSNLSVGEKLTILVTLLLAIIGASYTLYKEYEGRQKKLTGLFNLTWKNSTSIEKDEILGSRPFNEYYFVRPEDEKVRDCLKDEKSVLILGPPLGGKTRMVYEALRKSKKYDLIIPRSADIDIESFILPRQLKVWKPRLMFIDDLHRFAEQQNFEYLFEICRKNKINLIATCRSEIEYNKTKKRMLDKNLDLETELFGEIIEINEISGAQGKKIAKIVDKDWSKIKFNKTVGSVFMPLAEMHKRFEECTSEEKSILKAIKKLYICGVYEESQIFQLDQIRRVSANEGIKKEKYQWEELIKNLCEKEFTKIEKTNIDRVWAEEVYLEDIVVLNYSELHTFEEMLSIFEDIPEILFKVGNRVSKIGSVNLQKAELHENSHKNVSECSESQKCGTISTDYAMTLNNIGTAYRKLAEVEDKEHKLQKGTRSISKCSKNHNCGTVSNGLCNDQNNIGTAYSTLAEVEDKVEDKEHNCKKALEAFQNALKIITVEQFSIQYAITQNNIGIVYKTLAVVRR